MIKTKKISIDYSSFAVTAIEKAKTEYYNTFAKKASNSLIANFLTENTLGCPLEVKKEIVKSLYSILGHYNLIDLTTGDDKPFSKEHFNAINKTLENLILIFGGFESQKFLNDIQMRKIYMANNRSISIPADWIVVNEEEAEKFSEAILMECANSRVYNIPHFLIFCDKSAYNEWSFTAEFEDYFYKKILQIYPDFQIILNSQIETRRIDRDIVNLEEWSKAPVIGLFRIKTSNDLKLIREKDKSYTPPLGVYIEIPEK